jgi:hypothetical protein
MSRNIFTDREKNRLTLSRFPVPAKALVTAIILTMSIAMAGALGQVIIHDIIPTFFSDRDVDGLTGSQPANSSQTEAGTEDMSGDSGRGDLFAESPIEEPSSSEVRPFYQSEQFVWILKWTHIHLFGMSMIFIFMGAIAIFLNVSSAGRTWLVVLPFAGILIDIAAMWLKGYISPIFFWLHIPGGGLFGLVFMIVSLKALREMWWCER